jgi:hypothetical protein
LLGYCHDHYKIKSPKIRWHKTTTYHMILYVYVLAESYFWFGLCVFSFGCWLLSVQGIQTFAGLLSLGWNNLVQFHVSLYPSRKLE